MKKLALLLVCGLFAAICGTTFAVNVNAQKRKPNDKSQNGKIKKQPKQQAKQELQPATKQTPKIEVEVKQVDKPTETTSTNVERTPEQLALFDKLIDKAKTDGQVRILVQVGAAFTPEGDLPDGQRQVQRAGIASAQDTLLSQLARFNVTGVYKYQFSPLILMIANASAVEFMRNSQLVTNIDEDIIDFSNLEQSTALIGIPAVRSKGYSGSGQVVAVLDTGVDKNHTFLRNTVDVIYNINF